MQTNGTVRIFLLLGCLSAAQCVLAGLYSMSETEMVERKPLASPDDWNDALDEYTRIKREQQQQLQQQQLQQQQLQQQQQQQQQEQPTESQMTTSSIGGQNEAINRFQDYLLQAKSICARELRFEGDVDKSLLYEPLPTPQEKCLIECILKRTDLMRSDNRLSVQRIGSIAEMVSGRNPLVVSIAMATADHCNRFINAANPCDAAAQISQCIANEIKARKIKLFY